MRRVSWFFERSRYYEATISGKTLITISVNLHIPRIFREKENYLR